MVKLATPISNLFKDSIARDEIISRSDCLECREESLDSSELAQHLFHFDVSIVKPWSVEEKGFIRSAISIKSELRLISFHVASSFSELALMEGRFYPGGRRLSRQDMLLNTDANIAWLKKELGAREISIAVENNNYYPTPAYDIVTDPDFIAEIVLNNKISFLLDTAHARIAAHNRGEEIEDYNKGLPLDRIVQLHVSKHEVDNKGMAYDAHGLPDDDFFAETSDMIKRFSPEYLTIEYYKDKEGLIEALDKCRKLFPKPEGEKDG